MNAKQREALYVRVAQWLTDSGYQQPPTTPAMVREVHEALMAGKRSPDLPHGVIGRFIERYMLDEQHVPKQTTGIAP